MLTLIMCGILVSLSVKPIKRDIMCARVWKENTNGGPAACVEICCVQPCMVVIFNATLVKKTAWNGGILSRSQSSSFNQLCTAREIVLESAFHAGHT